MDIKVVGNNIYFDYYRYGVGGKLAHGNSFYLDLENNKVCFESGDCVNFLANIKDIVLGKSKINIASLEVYRSKSFFESIICRGVLGLKFCGHSMEHNGYRVPSSLTEEDFNEIFNFEKVRSLIEDYIVSVYYEGESKDV